MATIQNKIMNISVKIAIMILSLLLAMSILNFNCRIGGYLPECSQGQILYKSIICNDRYCSTYEGHVAYMAKELLILLLIALLIFSVINMAINKLLKYWKIKEDKVKDDKSKGEARIQDALNTVQQDSKKDQELIGKETGKDKEMKANTTSKNS